MKGADIRDKRNWCNAALWIEENRKNSTDPISQDIFAEVAHLCIPENIDAGKRAFEELDVKGKVNVLTKLTEPNSKMSCEEKYEKFSTLLTAPDFAADQARAQYAALCVTGADVPKIVKLIEKPESKTNLLEYLVKDLLNGLEKMTKTEAVETCQAVKSVVDSMDLNAVPVADKARQGMAFRCKEHLYG